MHVESHLLSASLHVDGTPVNWSDAEEDAEGLEINTKASKDKGWSGVWEEQWGVTTY